MFHPIRGLCRVALALTFVASSAASAAAQFRPPSDPATGEKYHVEVAGAFWNATPTIVISSESLGIPGTLIDLSADLGLAKKRIPEFRLVLRPAQKHKFRLSYLPIKYDTQSTVQRVFVFNGLEYPIGLPVNTVADLTTIRFGYEYDFIYRDRGYFGVLLDLKYTDVNVQLNSPIGSEFTTAVAPLPTIGFVGRGYVAPNVSITGEVSYFRVPQNLGGEDFGGRYLDYDFYGTVNFNDYVGLQTGYRSIHVDYFLDLDTGDIKFKGMYFAGVLRF